MKYFTVGPAELYPTCIQHFQEAFQQQLGSISHRSERFRSIYKHTDEQLRILLNIPSTHQIYFTSSATEIWERMLLNLVEKYSFHFVQGAFSEKFYSYACLLNKEAGLQKVNDGYGFDNLANSNIPNETELICLTQNETSSGIQIPEKEIEQLKMNNPQVLICCDIVSSVPYVQLNFNNVDSAFFSVQKGMGMPPGLGVWIANNACLEKAANMEAKHISMGAHFRLSSFEKNYRTFETPSTPNTVAIYVLGKIAEDMNRYGIERIRTDINEKFEHIHQFIERDERFTVHTKTKEHLSKTTIVLNSTISATDLNSELNRRGMQVAGGYGTHKKSQIRIANFPSSTLEEMNSLLHAFS